MLVSGKFNTVLNKVIRSLIGWEPIMRRKFFFLHFKYVTSMYVNKAVQKKKKIIVLGS